MLLELAELFRHEELHLLKVVLKLFFLRDQPRQRILVLLKHEELALVLLLGEQANVSSDRLLLLMHALLGVLGRYLDELPEQAVVLTNLSNLFEKIVSFNCQLG